MRPRVIEWAGAIARRKAGNPDVHFDTRKRFEIRPLRKNSTKVQLFVAAKEGGPGFAGEPIARYDSVEEAMEAARLSSYPKDNIIPREERPRRPYNRKAVAFVAPKRVTKAAKANKTADAKPVKATKRTASPAPVVTAKPKTVAKAKISATAPVAKVSKKVAAAQPVKRARKAATPAPAPVPVVAKAPPKKTPTKAAKPAAVKAKATKPKTVAAAPTPAPTPAPEPVATKAPARRLRVPAVKGKGANAGGTSAEVINFPAGGAAATTEATPPDAPETIAAAAAQG